MITPKLLVLATGGTIAGQAGSATRRDYRAGQIAIDEFLDQAEPLGLNAHFEGRQIAAIGSEDIAPEIWRQLHEACAVAMQNPQIDGIIITHGTDTAEETAFLLDLTLPTTKPVVLVGAMRPADAVGSDGLRNFANAVLVAGDAEAAGRGVLIVMSDRVIAARDARKARSGGTDAFRGFPRDAVAAVTPGSLEWFGAPWRIDDAARFALPQTLPLVPILYASAAMEQDAVKHLLDRSPAGVVIAGFGAGTMPHNVKAALCDAAKQSIVVVRSSRVDEGLVDREPSDDTNGFVAARALGPSKSRILLQVLLANGITDPAEIQVAFDRR